MDHSRCLQALQGLGASRESVGLAHAFLYGREMMVKINYSNTKPRTTPDKI